MEDLFTETFLTALVAGGVLAATLLFASLGEMVSEQAGVLNVGLEGMMLAGAYGGFVVALETESTWLRPRRRHDRGSARVAVDGPAVRANEARPDRDRDRDRARGGGHNEPAVRRALRGLAPTAAGRSSGPFPA